jgi:GMP synthase-like glutamine amidotransferase
MKPIVICRFAPNEGPGYFATYLERHNLPWVMVKLDAGDALPDVRDIAGLAMMGGPMSVNDDLPWIPRMLEPIRASAARGVPVIGHCLGGQMLAKALGAQVTRNPVKEIGWGEVRVEEGPLAAQWGPRQPFLSYHWHGETFALPQGAERIWSSAHCATQAFVIGPHLGMQCHIEMTADLIESWCETGTEEIEAGRGVSPAVQRPDEMRENIAAKLQALHAVADRVYDRWTASLGNS